MGDGRNGKMELERASQPALVSSRLCAESIGAAETVGECKLFAAMFSQH
jgi:hypothetical protein